METIKIRIKSSAVKLNGIEIDCFPDWNVRELMQQLKAKNGRTDRIDLFLSGVKLKEEEQLSEFKTKLSESVLVAIVKETAKQLISEETAEEAILEAIGHNPSDLPLMSPFFKNKNRRELKLAYTSEDFEVKRFPFLGYLRVTLVFKMFMMFLIFGTGLKGMTMLGFIVLLVGYYWYNVYIDMVDFYNQQLSEVDLQEGEVIDESEEEKSEEEKEESEEESEVKQENEGNQGETEIHPKEAVDKEESSETTEEPIAEEVSTLTKISKCALYFVYSIYPEWYRDFVSQNPVIEAPEEPQFVEERLEESNNETREPQVNTDGQSDFPIFKERMPEVKTENEFVFSENPKMENISEYPIKDSPVKEVNIEEARPVNQEEPVKDEISSDYSRMKSI